MCMACDGFLPVVYLRMSALRAHTEEKSGCEVYDVFGGVKYIRIGRISITSLDTKERNHHGKLLSYNHILDPLAADFSYERPTQ